MSRRRRRPSRARPRAGTVILILLIGGAALVSTWIEQLREGPPRPASHSGETSGAPKRPEQGKFEILTGLRLKSDRDNDGDSFILAGPDGDSHHFRIYFVDAPEKRLHRFNGERIDQQAAYFSITREQAIQAGEEARVLVDRLLRERPFHVATRWRRVFDSDRYYAFVFFDDSGEDISEILVSHGLARIHTEGADLPDGRRRRAFEAHLRSLEAEAGRQRKGAWRWSPRGN
jgi:endonuclease YncB( thermonuclease family)